MPEAWGPEDRIDGHSLWNANAKQKVRVWRFGRLEESPMQTSSHIRCQVFWEINAVIHAIMLRDRPEEKVSEMPSPSQNPKKKKYKKKPRRTHSQGIGIPATISMKCAH